MEIREQYLKGVPVEHEWAWCVIRLRHDRALWFPLVSTIRPSRSAAIEAFEDGMVEGTYRRMRRRGEARALRCRVQPHTFSYS